MAAARWGSLGSISHAPDEMGGAYRRNINDPGLPGLRSNSCARPMARPADGVTINSVSANIFLDFAVAFV